MTWGLAVGTTILRHGRASPRGARLLLLDEIWSEKRIPVDGAYVVAIPARDLLLVTGSNDKAAVAKLRELATKAAAQSSYKLTNELFTYRAGHFTLFTD